MKSLGELMALQGRVAVVTGGGGHIGGAICDTLAELGANIAVFDVNEEACSDTVHRVKETYGVDALPLPMDLSEDQMAGKAVKTVLKQLGRLDILVNCAALTGTSELEGWSVPFPDQRSDAWTKAMEIGLTAPFLLAQACAGALAASGHGSVINLGSIYGIVGPDMRMYEGTSMGNPAAYAASKGGLLQLTRWLATVMAPQIRVNAISPGGVWRNQPDKFHRAYLSRTPLGRMAKEEDIKGAVAFLASDLSAYVTGQNLVIDGGWTAW